MNICDYCIHKQTCTNKPLATTKCKDFEDKPKQTLFDRITQSPETLADKLVYSLTYGCSVGAVKHWYSTLELGTYFSKREEALAATIEKLKEVER